MEAINLGMLEVGYRSSDQARAVIDSLSERARFKKGRSRIVNLRKDSKLRGVSLSDEEIAEVFDLFERAGLGTFQRGRHLPLGYIAWHDSPIAVAQIVRKNCKVGATVDGG